MNLYALLAEVLVVVGLFVAGAFAVKGYNAQVADKAVAQDRAVASEAVQTEQAAALKKKDAIIAAANALAAQRGREKANAQRENEALQRKYGEAGYADPSVAAWRVTPVPAALRQLRRDAPGAGGGNPANGVRGAGGVAGPAPSSK